jgi:anti-sigma factor RsiW
MTAAFECDKVLLVQAELDGELDAAAAAALAAHRAECPVCRAAAAELAQARGLLAASPRDELYYAMPDDVRARLAARLSGAASPARPRLQARGGWGWWSRRWWPAPAGFGLGAACAAAVALLMLTSQSPDVAAQIVAGHIRALQPGHLEDVVSTDKHTVKPWFDGRIDFAPPVKDLAADRFPLKGGRLDYIAGRPVAALVYQRDKHLIDLYVWPVPSDSPRPPTTAEAQGYNIVHWREGGMALWAVSDLEPAQLRQFVEDWRRLP